MRDIFILYPLTKKQARNPNGVRKVLAPTIGSKRLIYDLYTTNEGVFLVISKVPYPSQKGRIYVANSFDECKALIFEFLKIKFKI